MGCTLLSDLRPRVRSLEGWFGYIASFSVAPFSSVVTQDCPESPLFLQPRAAVTRLGCRSGQDPGVWAFESEPGPLPACGRCYEWLRPWVSQQRPSLPQACRSSSRFTGWEASGGLIVRRWDVEAVRVEGRGPGLGSAAQLLAQDPSSGYCCQRKQAEGVQGAVRWSGGQGQTQPWRTGSLVVRPWGRGFCLGQCHCATIIATIITTVTTTIIPP